MREIKFRVWYKKTFEMQEVERIFFNEGTITVGKGMYSRTWFMEDVVLMQFTGIKDKNNKDIYESDIIKTYRQQILYVNWNHDQWRLFQGTCDETSIDIINDKIIGNIWENPEILRS